MSALTPEELGSMSLFACLSVEQLTLLLDRHRETTHQLDPFALALARLEAGRLRDLNQLFALQSADATTRLLDVLAYLALKSSGGQDLQA